MLEYKNDQEDFEANNSSWLGTVVPAVKSSFNPISSLDFGTFAPSPFHWLRYAQSDVLEVAQLPLRDPQSQALPMKDLDKSARSLMTKLG